MVRNIRLVDAPHTDELEVHSATPKGRAVTEGRPEPATCTDVVRPMTYGRERASRMFDSICTARTESGDYTASNCAIGRQLGVSEKWVRGARQGVSSLPFGVVFTLQKSLALELLNAARAEVESAGMSVDRSADAHGRRLSAQLGTFSASLDTALADGELSEGERRCLRRDLLELSRRVDEAIAGLEGRR
jgi:hypothetical protein